jgi:N-acetylglucosaminyldiphosphoundecaprenol N-acetyl-beta-D-mannosaminyltransferase
MFLVGARPEVCARAVHRLSAALPTWTIAGVDGYGATARDHHALRARLIEFQPDIVLLGLGMPKQEALLEAMLPALPPAYYATVGGAIDYLAEAKPLSPRWLGAIGLEWFWRLIHEPRRLARRYCIEPLHLLLLVARRSLKARWGGDAAVLGSDKPHKARAGDPPA